MDTRIIEPTSTVYVPPNVEGGYLWEGESPTTRDEATGTTVATVRDHLLAQKGIGDVTADAILADLDLDGDRKLSSLGSRQREHLDEAAAEHGAS